jgi:hypothetical protein
VRDDGVFTFGVRHQALSVPATFLIRIRCMLSISPL